MEKNCYVLDGYSIIYRSYFAFIRRPLFSPDGRNTSAVFGFFRTLFHLLDQYKPETFFIAMDSIGPTFRHKQYPPYKQTREKTPDDLKAQIPVIEEILEVLGVPIIRVNGFEADDIMATVSRKCNENQIPCYIISGDKDLLQLVKGSTRVIKPDSAGYREMDRQLVFEDKGVYPEQINDFLALVGDSADNIPGVKGIGPKTASKLLDQFGSLADLYTDLSRIKAAGQRKKLEEDRENAFLSRDLAALRYDVEIGSSVAESPLGELNIEGASELFLREGIRSLPGIQIAAHTPEVKTGPRQGELFADAPEEAPKGEYEAVLTPEALAAWIEKARNADYFAFDSETDSLDALSAQPVGFSLSVEEGKGCYIPLEAPETTCLSAEVVRKALKSLLEDTSVKLVGQNAKYDIKVLSRWGIDVRCLWFDTMVAAWLLDSSRNSFGMDSLAEDFLGYTTVHFTDLVPKGGVFSEVALDKAVFYAAEDADITLRLCNRFQEKLSEASKKLLFELEMPLSGLLARMESRGMVLDGEELKRYGKEMDRELVGLEDEIYILCGKTFNIKSTKQLQQVLFEERKLTPIKKTRTGYSTDLSVLSELAREDPVPEKVLRHRLLSKLKSTYIDTLPGMIHPETGRIHTHYLQTGTATGRLSSQNPNMQNIPIRGADGRRIRSAFRAGEGKVLVTADYSQIELVVLAHLSEDPVLLETYREGKDIHRQTAATIFGVLEEHVDSEMRQAAKTVNFGVIYGMSAFRLSRELGIPRGEASDFINRYFERFTGVKQLMARVIEDAEKSGIVTTLMGHERRIPSVASRNKTERQAGERMAFNTLIQGSAADIVKRAMVELDRRIRRAQLPVDILLQVHDEIIVESSVEDAELTAALLKEVMEAAVELKVPLRASVETGIRWGDFHA